MPVGTASAPLREWEVIPVLPLLVVLCIFAWGGMLLILCLGAQAIDAEHAKRRRESDEIGALAAGIPRFFFKIGPAPTPGATPLDDAFVSEVRKYVAAEQILAAQFVSEPSVASLYRQSDTRITPRSETGGEPTR